MSLLVTIVPLNGPDDASLECLAKSLKDLMSKTAFSRGTRRVWHILHMYGEVSSETS